MDLVVFHTGMVLGNVISEGFPGRHLYNPALNIMEEKVGNFLLLLYQSSKGAQLQIFFSQVRGHCRLHVNHCTQINTFVHK